MIWLEFADTGSLSTRRFQGLFFGKIGQPGACGSRSAAAEPPATSASTNVSAAGYRWDRRPTALAWSRLAPIGSGRLGPRRGSRAPKATRSPATVRAARDRRRRQSRHLLYQRGTRMVPRLG